MREIHSSCRGVLAGRVEQTLPRRATRRRRHREFPGIIAGIHQKQQATRGVIARAEQGAHAANVAVPVVLRHLAASRVQPAHILDSGPRGQPLEEGLAAKFRMPVPQARQPLHEGDEIRVPCAQSPVHPGNRIVLAVGVVVAELRPPELVPRLQHGNTLREEQGRQDVAHLTPAQCQHRRIIARTLHAAVPTEVVAGPIGIVFEVGRIVPFVVRDEVAQREAVVRRDEVDVGRGFAAVVLEDVTGAGEALRPFAELAAIPAPERTHRVAITVVPLRPTRRKSSQLVAAPAHVPMAPRSV